LNSVFWSGRDEGLVCVLESVLPSPEIKLHPVLGILTNAELRVLIFQQSQKHTVLRDSADESERVSSIDR